MDKGKIFNGILAVAVIALFVLHFTSKPEITVADEKVEVKDSVPAAPKEDTSVVQLLDSLGLDSVKDINSSKVGYFDVEQLVEKCPFFLRREKDFLNRDNQLINLQGSMEKQLQTKYGAKEKSLMEAQQRGLDVREQAMKTQMEFEKEKQALGKKLIDKEKVLANEKKSYLVKKNEIIFKALEDLNKYKKLDYVLVKSRSNSVVFPMNDKNDITKELILIINKRHK